MHSPVGDQREPPFCWMCDAMSGPRAAEHVYPRWLLTKLGASAHTFPGAVAASSLTVSEVCATCNSGWMSGLEVVFRSGAFEQPRRGPLVDTTQAIIARWFAKTAVLLNVALAHGNLVEEPTRHALRRGLPVAFAVHLARRPQAPIKIEYRIASGDGVLVTAIRLGELVGVVLYAEPSPSTRPERPLLRIAPQQRRRIAWDQLPSVRSLAEATRARLIRDRIG